MDPKLREVSQGLERFKAAFVRSDFDTCTKLLSQLKLKLIFCEVIICLGVWNYYMVWLFWDIYEHAVVLSVKTEDQDAFERDFFQLKPYYTDTGGRLPPSPQEYPILGLNLLRLLVQNRIAEFHTELELLSATALENACIKHAVELEQSFMEGAYNRVLSARQTVPHETYVYFMDLLAKTVRDEIAGCSEKAYDYLSINDAQHMLLFSSDQELFEYIKELDRFAVNDCFSGSGYSFYILMLHQTEHPEWEIKNGHVFFQRAKESAPCKEIPSLQLINQTLSYARELERIQSTTSGSSSDPASRICEELGSIRRTDWELEAGGFEEKRYLINQLKPLYMLYFYFYNALTLILPLIFPSCWERSVCNSHPQLIRWKLSSSHFEILGSFLLLYFLSNQTKDYVNHQLPFFSIREVKAPGFSFSSMESVASSSSVAAHQEASNYDEYSMQQSLLFGDSLKDLKSLRKQLYSAAEYFEQCYHKDDQKQIVLETLKDYAIKALVNTVDHLGSVTYKVNTFLDDKIGEVHGTELQFSCIEQRIRTCQEFINRSGLCQQSLMLRTPKHHKRYTFPGGETTNTAGHTKPTYQTCSPYAEDDLHQFYKGVFSSTLHATKRHMIKMLVLLFQLRMFSI
ncbi:hypothetical protein PVL29_001677 [Vitis rotundifolia]|uniref:PCI domain-containing protein n=1 Tax=Vitis rotundifolia TaxID=103349 RepID=A0AA39E671_VITRO|nr:hypothetical protein PVL29_001677 [Vitis rotundifolia]